MRVANGSFQQLNGNGDCFAGDNMFFAERFNDRERVPFDRLPGCDKALGVRCGRWENRQDDQCGTTRAGGIETTYDGVVRDGIAEVSLLATSATCSIAASQGPRRFCSNSLRTSSIPSIWSMPG